MVSLCFDWTRKYPNVWIEKVISDSMQMQKIHHFATVFTGGSWGDWISVGFGGGGGGGNTGFFDTVKDEEEDDVGGLLLSTMEEKDVVVRDLEEIVVVRLGSLDLLD